MSTDRLKRYKPTSSGIRGKIMVDRSSLHKGACFKSLTKIRSGERGVTSGKRVARRKTGKKVRLRMVDYKNDFSEAEVVRLEYDPNRSARLALMRDSEGRHSYILAGEGLRPGDRIENGKKEEFSRVQLKDLKEGEIFFGLSKDRWGKAQIARGAGTYVKLVNWNQDWATLKLPSGELKKFHKDCWVNLGKASNPNHYMEVWSKAGTALRKGRRQIVRGMAANICDHPMGGKCGKTKGKHPLTRWGKKAKGIKTRSPRKSLKLVVRKRNFKD